jgi:hypothetical protein
MITHAVAQRIKGTEGLHTISALTHRQMVELLRRKVISPELFDEHYIVEVMDPEDTERRYCLCRNPQTARREGTTRQRLLERAQAQLDKIAGSRRRATEKRLGARVGRVLERTKVGKFIQWQVVEGKLLWSFDQDKIAAERLFDGCIHCQLRCAPRADGGRRSGRFLQEAGLGRRSLPQSAVAVT